MKLVRAVSISFLLLSAFLLLNGCISSGETPTENAPAAKGANGVPMLSQEQLNKLPPEQQARIKQDQEALQKASGANMQRHQTGQMPNGG